MSSIEDVPGIFNTSNVIVSILFFGSSWLVLHLGAKNSKVTYPVLIGLVAWYAATYFLGRAGFFAATPLFAPMMIFAFIAILIAMKFIYSSRTLQEAFSKVPLHWVMSVQVFRVMGVGFLALYAMKVLPGEFAIPTGLGDVFIGITGPIVALLYLLGKSFSKQIAILWNYAGIADLVMAISLGTLTYSRPFQVIPTEVPNDPIALYPLVIIPVFAVPLSVLLHLFSLRTLKKVA